MVYDNLSLLKTSKNKNKNLKNIKKFFSFPVFFFSASQLTNLKLIKKEIIETNRSNTLFSERNYFFISFPFIFFFPSFCFFLFLFFFPLFFSSYSYLQRMSMATPSPQLFLYIPPFSPSSSYTPTSFFVILPPFSSLLQ